MTSKAMQNNTGSEASLYDMVMMMYAAGTLDTAHRVAVEAHIALHPDATNTLSFYEVFGGEMLASIEGAPLMGQDSLNAVLARLDDPVETPSRPILHPCPIYPDNLVEYCGWTAASTPWKAILPGVSIATPQGQKLQLLKVSPGTAMPEHDHKDLEVTLMLDGSYHDEAGSYHRGDLVIMDSHMEHKPVADADTGCICLIINDARPKFTGLMGPVLNLLSR